MNASEFRANAAGYLDASCVLIDQIVASFKEAEKTPHPSIPAQLSVAPAYYEQLAEARRIIGQCANWLLDPNNTELERKG